MMQYHSPGFLRNSRQYRQFGLAALEVAQTCVKHWCTPGGLVVPDSASSNPSHWQSTKSHPFGWRDCYDAGVRWRQVSEPFDPVFYIDGLTRTAFEEGFGLQTPMVSGQNLVVRYYPQFPVAFALTKRLIVEQCPLTDRMAQDVMDALTCEDVYSVLKRDFWVIAPCHSTACPGRVMEGTRLTIQYKVPNGYEYTIRTPGTPSRWMHFEEELHCLWVGICAEMVKPVEERSLDKLAHLVLASYYYWVNMGPLSRGSAAVGLCVLVGMSLACGLPISLPCPPLVQLDWNGILTPTPSKFAAEAMPIVFPSLHEPSRTFPLAAVPDVVSVFPTLRAVIEVLNTPSAPLGASKSATL